MVKRKRKRRRVSLGWTDTKEEWKRKRSQKERKTTFESYGYLW